MRLVDADWLLAHKYKELASYDTYDLEAILEKAPTIKIREDGKKLIISVIANPYEIELCEDCGKEYDKIMEVWLGGDRK